MTACRNKASRAVTAALVGVLSVGAVPMVALAATDGASVMAGVESSDAFSEAIVTLENGTEYTYGSPIDLTVKQVEIKKGDVRLHTKDLENDDYKIYVVKADAEGKPGTETVAKPTAVGTYYVVVEAVGGTYEGGKATVKFSIVGQDLGQVVAKQDGKTVDNGSHPATYDAEPVDLSFESGSGAKLAEGIDYSVKYYKYGEDSAQPGTGSTEAPTDANSYYAVVTGMGKYEGKSDVVEFKINPCNLATADIVVPTVVGASTALETTPTTVNGSEALAKEVKVNYSGVVNGLGAFTGWAVPVTDKDPNFTIGSDGNSASQSVTAYRVAALASFTYNGEAMPTEMTINAKKGETFDASKVAATYVDANGDKKDIPAATVTGQPGAWSMVATYADGTPVTSLATLNTPGKYILRFTANPAAPWDFGGSVQVSLNVTNGTIDCDESLYVKYMPEDEVITSLVKTYDGKAINKTDFKTFLYDGDTLLTAGTDYKVKFYNADHEEIDSIVDAGEYTMEIEGGTYEVLNGTFDITVEKAEVTGLRIVVSGTASSTRGDRLTAVNGRYSLAYKDGSEIKPAYEYTTGERNDEGQLIWYSLDSSTIPYVLTVTKDGEGVEKITELGDYVATITASDADVAKNYVFSADPFEFSVAKTLTFVDVTPDMYYYDSVEQAYKNNYVRGYSDGKLYGPTDSMSRADVAVVLYRMSGATAKSWGGENSYNENTGWDTGYVDCDNNAYYAEAVAWARKAGIVAGLDETHFGPTQKVTREQFATMLANYAKARGDFKAADESVLDKYGDSDQVSAFARGTVAWAVEEGVMGGSSNLMPTNEITRADVAVMAVNYQPASLVETPEVNPGN